MSDATNREIIFALAKKEFAKNPDCMCIPIKPLIREVEEVLSLPDSEVRALLLLMNGEEIVIEGSVLFLPETHPC